MSLPSLEQYARILSVHEDDRLSSVEEKKAVVPARGPPMRLPIPAKLLTLSKKSTNPVPKKGRGKGKGGWRAVTAGDVANYGLKAWQLAKHLATLINVEEKVFDVDGSGGTTITSTPTVVNLTNIAQGNDYFNRSGDSILGQSIEFRARLNSNAAQACSWIRILIVSDRLQRGADPVLGDVLQGGTNPSVQPYLEPQDQRFDHLYDHLIHINTVGVDLATGGTSTAYISSRIPVPSLFRKWNKHIKYQGTTAADGSNWIGGLYLMAVSGDATNGPNLSYTFRLRFTDN